MTGNYERPLTDNAADSPSLPPRFYTDSEVLEIERRRIFSREWLFVGHVSELNKAGDFVTRQLNGQNIAVVRGVDGELRAFYNICRHRGHTLLSGSGNRSVIVCPYHAWSYDLDGTLLRIPGIDEDAQVNTPSLCLKTLRIDTVAGFVFVSPDAYVPKLSSRFPGFESGIREQFPALDELSLTYEGTATYASNWKVDVDNYLECYHCGPSHPAFRSFFEYGEYAYELNDHHIRMEAPATLTDNSAYSFSPDTYPKNLYFWYLWPNITFNLFPGTASISVLSFDPDTPDSSDILIKVYSTGEDIEDPQRFSQLGSAVFTEDQALCESVQQGMHSEGYEQSLFVTGDSQQHLSEHAVHFFQKKVWDRVIGKG